MPRYIEKAEKMTLPVVPLRGIVAYPSIPINFEVVRDVSIAAVEASTDDDMYIFLAAQKEMSVENPQPGDLFSIGTVAKIKQTLKTPEGNIRVIAEGVCRAKALSYFKKEDYFCADVMNKTVALEAGSDIRTEALMRETAETAEKILEFQPAVSKDFILAMNAIKNPGLLADFIASSVLVKYTDKQKILEVFEPLARLETLTLIIENEIKLLEFETDIHKKVREQLDDNQREYYLREQLKIIQNELGGDSENESDEYTKKINEANLSDEVREKLLKEVGHLSKTSIGSPEGAVIRNYLDTCLDIPWNKTTSDRLDIAAAKKILDADHDGLTKVKERILEFLAVKQLNPDIKNQIICLLGPPGVGKTSVASSVARAMKRKFVRVSLGGVRDEADIRGHRKTYIGAMPGRIITALTQCKTRNPVMLLDEIDKMSRDIHGDPSSALLEVLDAEQNHAFRDHFVEVPVDLSECMFIATANTLEGVPRPLIDRMEIIELYTYTRYEKLAIAKNHLLSKQLKRHGLNKRILKITDDALMALIDNYTRESGVRNLEREIASLCRKAAKKIVSEELPKLKITASDLKEYLGPDKMIPEKIADENEIGVVNGLAYTESGGDLLKIEAVTMNGTGKLELTGSLGDVMKESARIAISYIRANADKLKINDDFSTKKDIHIHVPEGAVPKDGPSAGVTITTALVSVLSGIPVRRDVAMTGEITLTGKVLPIGGLREKTTAAYAAGVRTILIPFDNERDLEDIDPVVRENTKFIPCRRISEVLDNALAKNNSSTGEDSAENEKVKINVPEIEVVVSDNKISDAGGEFNGAVI